MRRRTSAGDILTTLTTLTTLPTTGDDMDEIIKFFPTVLTRFAVNDPFLSVATFCGVGMLASLLLLILDPALFGAWIYP
jgi:hypothetical protein